MSLITTIAEFKKYIAIDGNTKIVTLLPYIEEAEQLYLVELLGQAFYDELLPLYKSSMLPEDAVPLSEDNAALLPYIQRCLAYYSQLQAMLHLSSTFGEHGIRQERGEDNDPAPRWLQDKMQFHALKNGDIHADKLLAFLEEKSTVSKYGTWYASSANTRNSGCIVYSTAIASRHIAINDSRRVFRQLKNTIREIETRSIPKLIGQDQYDELVLQLKTDTLTNANRNLIDKLEPLICKRALSIRLPFMRVNVFDGGIFLYSGNDESLKPTLASDADIKTLRLQLMDGEFGYMADEQEVRQFILDNINTYPLIKASPVYTVQPDPGPTWESKNDPNNKFFAV